MSSTTPSTTPPTTSDTRPTPGDRFQSHDGLHGEVEHLVGDRIILRLSDGTRALVGANRIGSQGAQGWIVDLSRKEIEAEVQRARTSRTASTAGTSARSTGGPARASAHPSVQQEVIVLPVIEEQVEVGKQVVETGRVRIRKLVREEQHDIAQDLRQEEVHVQRVPVNRVVEDTAHPPQPRQEGQTLVIPLLEEQVIVQKRLVVREELHISRTTTKQPKHQTVTLRKETAQVERLAPGAT